MIWRLLFFVGVTLAAGAAAAVLSWNVWGPGVAVASAVALALCLVPATATLLLSEWSLSWRPEYQVAAILGGTGIRIFVVAIIAFALYQQVEWLRDESGFWTWVLGFYGLTLALEVTTLLWAIAARKPAAAPAGAVGRGATAAVSTPE